VIYYQNYFYYPIQLENMEIYQMDENTLYKTAVAVAVTEISPISIYHYTRDFPEFFTAAASQHKRGRRWSEEDITTLLSIQSLYHERKGREKIREALAAGWRINNQPLESQEAAEVISKLLQVSNQFRTEAKEFRYQAQLYMNRLNSYMLRMEKDHTDLENMKKALIGQAKEIAFLRSEKRTFINFGH
jgi:hypothetical protein